MNNKKSSLSLNWQLLNHRLTLLALDIVVILLSMGLALFLRFDLRFSSIDSIFWTNVVSYMPINVILTLILFSLFHMYTALWRFATTNEMMKILQACLLSSIELMFGMFTLKLSIPRSYYFLYFVCLFGMSFCTRFSQRFFYLLLNHHTKKNETDHYVRTMVVGAGAAGFMILREIKDSTHVHRNVVCVIDDAPEKLGSYILGVPVQGDRTRIKELAEKHDIQEIIIAIPTLKSDSKKELLEICQSTGCHVLTLPGIYQLVEQKVSVAMLREVQIEDLLERTPVDMDLEDVKSYMHDKIVLVTGGGGSIGSEICRQAASYAPRQLIIFDIYENNAYDIQNDLKHQYPKLDLQVLIGSVRNKKRVEQIFETYHPDLVFHAAAHKHVPLMEDSPCEAIKNNVGGTWNVAEACHKYKVRKMVLISTDKAVRPTNVMGTTKRICEIIIRGFSGISETEFSAVRFGNVLGSNGSVIPLFRKQIEAGGPVTVTHPDVIRYFMTIPEAVNLVLQCGALAKGGELFILDMGNPVKIMTLAENMIRLSGLVPGEDIKIEVTGLRAGEKLYEELLIDENNQIKTEKERIFVARQPMLDYESVRISVEELLQKAYEEDSDIRHYLKQIVPEYTENT